MDAALGRKRLVARRATPDWPHDGSGGGIRFGKRQAAMVRVPDGFRDKLAGPLIPLSIVPAHRLRLPQTLGEVGIRIAHRPATGRPTPDSPMGGRNPPRRVS